MSVVTIKLAPVDVMSAMYVGPKGRPAELVAENITRYHVMRSFETELTGIDAAEEAFDLTNNPSRWEERLEKYGEARSLSVGDVADVDGVEYICLFQGWHKVEK